MADIIRNILRTEKTDIAGSVDVTPSGGSTGTGIVAADLVDGFNKKTVSFAAGETSKPVSFAVVDDALVEGTETYRLTMSNPLPSGVFPNGAFVEGTVADNDSSTTPTPNPSTNIYGPTSTTDTGWVEAGQNYDFSSKIEDTTWTLHLRSNDNTGKGGHVLMALGSSVSMSAKPVDATTGAVAQDGDGWLSNQFHDSTAVAGGLSLFVSVRGGKITVLQVNGKNVGEYLAANGALAGNWLRFRTGKFGNGTDGAAQTTTVINKS